MGTPDLQHQREGQDRHRRRRRGRRARGDHADEDRLVAELHDRRHRHRPVADEQDDRGPRLRRASSGSCRTTAPPSPSTRARPPRRAWRSPPRACRATAREGWSLFQKQKLGASNFQQQVTYQQALEGELTQTIEQVRACTSSQVQPGAARAAALRRPGLAGTCVGAPEHRRRGARRGLRARHRAARDGRREGPVAQQRLDHRQHRPAPVAAPATASANGPTANLKQAAENRFNMDLSTRLQALLNQAVGLGKGSVQVNADLNVDQTTKDAAAVREQGRAADRAEADREPQGQRRGERRGRHRLEHPQPTRPAARAATTTTRTRPRTPPSASARPSRTRTVAPGHDQQARRGGAGGQDRRPGRGRASSSRRSPRPPASTRPAATRSRSRRCRSPRPPRPSPPARR